jgi:hypothetical protein
VRTHSFKEISHRYLVLTRRVSEDKSLVHLVGPTAKTRGHGLTGLHKRLNVPPYIRYEQGRTQVTENTSQAAFGVVILFTSRTELIKNYQNEVTMNNQNEVTMATDPSWRSVDATGVVSVGKHYLVSVAYRQLVVEITCVFPHVMHRYESYLQYCLLSTNRKNSLIGETDLSKRRPRSP